MKEDIQKCIEVLKKGGLILYPTDTIWGIGCDATNAKAVQKVYELKKRADNKALIVLLDSEEHLDHYVVDVPEMASERIRVSNEKFSHELCEKFGRPIVSTSANVSGEPSPKIFSEVTKVIVDGVDYVVKYRQDDNKPADASNIILLGSDGTFKILR